MERRVYEAAAEGSVISLLNLLQDDALVLDRAMVGCYAETPLHIASMLGHVEFVQEILNRKPELAGELDARKSSPLHLATAKGYVSIVKALVTVNPEMCFIRDRDGRNPLHIAAIKGHIGVLIELVQVKPHAARILMDCRETILHVCVRYNQLEAMKFLVETMDDDEFVNSKDDDGNTILHLAVADKQIEAIKFLISKTGVNAVNAYGSTALDVLTQSRRDLRDWNIGELLRSAGALSAKDIHSSAHEHRNDTTETSSLTSRKVHNQMKNKDSGTYSPKKQDNWLEQERNTLMVVASLIATMTFQVGVDPPSMWLDTSKGGTATSEPLAAGFSIMTANYPYIYSVFFACNTTGFIASVSVILLLISGFPTKGRLFVWILMAGMWIAVTAMTLTYLFSLAALTKSKAISSYAAGIVQYVWFLAVVILLLGHTIRLMMRIIKHSKNLLRRRRHLLAFWRE